MIGQRNGIVDIHICKQNLCSCKVIKRTTRPLLDTGKVFVQSRIKKCYLEQTRLPERNSPRLPIGFTTIQIKVVLQIFSKIISSPIEPCGCANLLLSLAAGSALILLLAVLVPIVVKKMRLLYLQRSQDSSQVRQ